MKRITILTIYIVCLCGVVLGQNIQLDFPKFPNQTVKLYYFQGNKVDSLSTTLNAAGTGVLHTPSSIPPSPSSPHGMMVQLVIPDVGGVECIIGEPNLQIICKEDAFNKETVSFPGSKENAFLYDSFNRKSQLMEKQGWLQTGKRFYSAGSTNLKIIEKDLKHTLQDLESLDKEIAASPLYAARFIEWVDFMNRLYNAEQQRDPEKASLICNEMENMVDIQSLYTSGELWSRVHNFYISMFNRINKPDKQDEYAASIIKTASRLSGAVQVGFFDSSVNECERFGWVKSQEIMAKHIAKTYPEMNMGNNNLQRLVGLFRTDNGNIAPALVGVDSKSAHADNGITTLLIFYESGCNSCDIAISEIKTHYTELLEKKIRVVSIAADHDSLVYEYHANNFPWEDKLCDYQGFEGENFKNYGVIGTPTIFIVDEKGVIQGRYAKLKETGLFE